MRRTRLALMGEVCAHVLGEACEANERRSCVQSARGPNPIPTRCLPSYRRWDQTPTCMTAGNNPYLCMRRGLCSLAPKKPSRA